MRKTWFVWLAAVLLLAGCTVVAKQPQTAPSQNGVSLPKSTETSAEQSETRFQPSVPPTFLDNPIDPDDPSSAAFMQCAGNAVETEQGLFCFANHLLYHAEPGSTELHPYCGIPDCRHDSADCEAWFEAYRFASSGLGFCDGKLWLVAPDPEDTAKNELLRIDPETRQRETVREMPLPEFSKQPEYLTREFFFHKDKLFELVKPDDSLPLEERQSRLLVMDLRTGEVAEPFTALLEQRFKENYVQPYLLTAFGDQLYSQVSFFHEEIIDGYPTTVMEPWIVRLDPQTGDWTQLVLLDSFGGTWFRDENTLYVSDGHGVFLEYDMASGELRRIETGPDVFCRAYDDAYIYCYDLDITRLYILSRAYEVQAEIELPENHQIIGAVQNTVYIQGGDPDPMSWMIDYKLDVSDAGKRELTLEPLKWREAP